MRYKEDMSTNINNLIMDISGALKRFAEGKLSYNNANEEYKRLFSKYEQIVNKHKTNDRNIEGLCYYNNIENFSLLSGIFRINDNDIYPLTSYGDSALISKAMNAIFGKKDSIKTNNILMIAPGEDGILSHSIYLYPLISDSINKTLFASVSSSAYFSQKKFLFIGKLLKNILNLTFEENTLYENNYFLNISNDIDNYLKNNIDDIYSVRVTLFVFTMVEKIFNHMGIAALIEVSETIFDILTNDYKHNSKCYTLSIKDYLVVERLNKQEMDKADRIRLDFTYKNINIPYQTLKLNIDAKESIHSLWDKILTFENYLFTGDIIK